MYVPKEREDPASHEDRQGDASMTHRWRPDPGPTMWERDHQRGRHARCSSGGRWEACSRPHLRLHHTRLAVLFPRSITSQLEKRDRSPEQWRPQTTNRRRNTKNRQAAAALGLGIRPTQYGPWKRLPKRAAAACRHAMMTTIMASWRRMKMPVPRQNTKSETTSYSLPLVNQAPCVAGEPAAEKALTTPKGRGLVRLWVKGPRWDHNQRDTALIRLRCLLEPLGSSVPSDNCWHHVRGRRKNSTSNRRTRAATACRSAGTDTNTVIFSPSGTEKWRCFIALITTSSSSLAPSKYPAGPPSQERKGKKRLQLLLFWSVVTPTLFNAKAACSY